MNWLAVLGNLGSIFTALVAVFAYADYRRTLYRRMRAVENAVAKKTQPNDNSLTISQVATIIKATEDQVIEAAAKSKKVESSGGKLGNGYCLRLQKHSCYR